MKNLRPSQQAAVDRAADEFTKRCLDISPLGAGKTLLSVELAKRLGAKTVVVVGPLAVRYSWMDTFEGQGIDLPFSYVNNKNKAGKQALDDMLHQVPGIYYVGREFFRSKKWVHLKCDYLIWDESHVMAGDRGRSASARALRTVKHIGYLKFNSATPFGSSFEGGYSVAHALWPSSDVDGEGSFARWRERWAATEYSHFVYDKTVVVGERNPGAFMAELPCVISAEGTKLDQPVFEPIYVDLSPKQQKLYRQMETEGIAWLEANPLVAEFPMTKSVRLQQITLGVCDIRPVTRRKRNPDTLEMESYESDEVYFEDDCESTKLDALQEILADLGNEKVLITCDSTKFTSIAAKRIGAFEWTGNSTQDARERAKRDFIHGDLKYIMAHPAAIGEGVDGLQLVSHILIRVSRSWQSVLEEQLVGRLNRQGQTKQVVVMDILGRSTIDDPKAETLLTREIAMRSWKGQH